MASCYNGCWDSRTQARFDAEDKSLKELKERCPTAHITYYPNGAFWLGFDDLKIVTPELDSKGAVIEAMLELYPFH